MTVKRIVLVFCLLLIPFSTSAQESARTYVIKKGDTLWGISQRFIKDPYYWPGLWSNNPEIRNPHFIYPGQRLAIYDGRIEIVPTLPSSDSVIPETRGPEGEAEAEPAAAASTEPLTVAEPTITIHTMGGARGFVGTAELDHLGILVDTVDNRILMAGGDKVFVKPSDPATAIPGQMFSLFETGSEILHPLTGKPVGFQVTELGSLQITEAGPKVATAVITSSLREIQRGAKMLPYQPPVQEIELKKASKALVGTLIEGGEGKIAISQHDIIYIDLGAEDGLETGNLLYISRPRKATEQARGEEALQLPDTLLGSAVVLETHPRTSAALVLKAADTMFRGDRITSAIE